MNFITKLLISAFGAGFLFWPGFWGSWVGWILAWQWPQHFVWIFLSLVLVSYALCYPAKKITGKADPQIFVLDEVCGMMLSVWGLPHNLWIYIAAYALFRILDVTKPGPIGKLEMSQHPFSIMNDDMAAGLASNLLLRALLLLCPAF